MNTKKMYKRELWIEAYDDVDADSKLNIVLHSLQFINDGTVLPVIFSVSCYALIKQLLLPDSIK